MFTIIGYVVVLASVFGGYAAAGGHLAALYQPLELVMIGGAAVGAFLTSNGADVIKLTIKTLPSVFKSAHYDRQYYLDLLSLMYTILLKARKQGLASIENDVDNPHESPLFTAYPKVAHDHHIVEFITDYLRLMVSGNFSFFQMENLIDNELDAHHAESAIAGSAVTRMADGMPAFGIVAAVMGVVHCMESISLPPAELGLLIAHALVGTFLGILLGYGFIGPIGVLLDNRAHESAKSFLCVKVTLLASLNGYAPQVAIEFGRKVLYSAERPSAAELEEMVKALRSTTK